MAIDPKKITPVNSLEQDIALLAKYHYGLYYSTDVWVERYIRLMEIHIGLHRSELTKPESVVYWGMRTLEWLNQDEWKSDFVLRKLFLGLLKEENPIHTFLSEISQTSVHGDLLKMWKEPDPQVRAYLDEALTPEMLKS